MTSTTPVGKADNDDDSSDSLSTISFRSADSHFDNDSDRPRLSPSTCKPSPTKQNGKNKSESEGKKTQISQHEKELQKLDARRAALDAKLASIRSKSAKDTQSQTLKEKEAIRKAEEKHAKEMGKQEEKYQREIEKIERRRKREEEKVVEKKRKEREKDERRKVEKERDEVRAEVKGLKADMEVWKRQVGELQKENTGLVVKVGRLERKVNELKGSTTSLASMESENGNEKDNETNQTASSTPERAPVVKNLLREERAQGHSGARNRGVSFGSAVLNPSTAERPGSRGPSTLKRVVSMGMAMGTSGGGSSEQGKGPPSEKRIGE